MRKLAIVTTHPIQYNAPLFRLLHDRKNISVKVFYTWGEQAAKAKYDPGFGKSIAWDIPLLEGYPYHFEQNNAKDPGSHHFNGIKNPNLCRNISDWAPDALLVYGWSFNSHLNALRYFHKKIPILFRGDSTLLKNKGFLLPLARKIFLRWVYKHIDQALYVGKHNRAYYEEFGLNSKQLLFAPHAVDNRRFMQDEEQKTILARSKRRELNIEENALVFMYAGKLDPNKNVDLLLDAFIKVQEIGIHLVIVGNGSTESMLRTKVESSRNVHFLPFQNQLDMPVVYRICDVFVLPSRSETWGLSINEAMASGRAVLVSENCGCAPDLVKNGVNGFIFQDSLDSLAGNMKEMIKRKNEKAKWFLSSQEIIKDWNYESVCKVIEEIV